MIDTSLLESLTKKDRSEVRRAERTYHADYEQVVRTSLKRFKRRADQPGVAVKTRDLSVLFGSFHTKMRERAFIDRLWRNDPSYLIRGLSTSARLNYLRDVTHDEPKGYTAYGLLEAMAVNDQVAVKAYLRRFSPPFEGGHSSTDLLANSIYAAAIKDAAGLDNLKPKLERKRANRFCRAMYDCLLAVSNYSSTGVIGAVEQMLKFNRRTDLHLWMDKIVCIEANAFYRLVEEWSPSLVADFDTARPLPWDSGLHQLTHDSSSGPARPFNVARASEVIDRWLLQLPESLDVEELLESL